ncbi:hypothetical protein nbrc107696_22570 [Gordonia spumicola]|uniref:Aldehyde dehydrogenase domain-containing protein n=1 Tax=Gordonia spumicola TaxID=589161 RepID=A0A7I9V9P3_9ACTN|nr:aldehyde dehydrogenase family protein [Gordonia spumicola]GEE01811.1 hypothetical protein nbrc107696_22570 [Gordonia spumicola]
MIPVGQDTAGGYFLGPTLIEGLEPGSDLEAAELFGPVLVIHRVPDLAAAIALSNNTDFGNAASIFTRTGAVAAEYERRVRAGNVGVNTFPGPAAFITMGGYGTSSTATPMCAAPPRSTSSPTRNSSSPAGDPPTRTIRGK